MQDVSLEKLRFSVLQLSFPLAEIRGTAVNFSLSSPIGEIGFSLSENALESIDFYSQKHPSDTGNDLALSTAAQLNIYFRNPHMVFDIPLRVKGTAFQQRVWSALRDIPAGETRSYGDLAKLLKSSPRAIGNACRRNPVPIVIPCHRVISAKGIGGFSGDTSGENIRIKRWLLSHEGVII